MSCYPSCPDCRCGTVESAASPSIGGSAEGNEAATCSCFPANERCPSEAVCCQGLASGCACGPRVWSVPDLSGACDEGNESATGAAGHPEYLRLVDDIRRLHIVKSGGYGTGTDPMANFTAVADLTDQPRYLYPVHRSIEKLTRVLSLHAQGRGAELEEEFLDVASLLLCAAAMLRDDT